MEPSFHQYKRNEDHKPMPPQQPVWKSSNSIRTSPVRVFDKENNIDINNYGILSKKNPGEFGTVSICQNKITKQQYVAKTIKSNNNTANKQRQLSTLREMNNLIRLYHPTIIRFHGASPIDLKKKEKITILMDFMKNGSLADIFQKKITNTQKQIILVGIARAMMFLHSKNIINGNLKPENVLLDDDYKPHLTDFGLSKIFESSLNQFQGYRNAAYIAPEVIRDNTLSKKADVYSFGILMFEIVTGTRAYPNELRSQNFKSSTNLLFKVMKGLRPTFTTKVKPTLKRMIEKCLSENPRKRPTFSELYSKLSLTSDNYYYNSKDKICKAVIESEEDYNGDDDDDDDDFDVDDANEKIKNRFCFDDVDVQQLLSYVNEIGQENKDDRIESLKKIIDQQKKEIENLKNQIEKSNIKKIDLKLTKTMDILILNGYYAEDNKLLKPLSTEPLSELPETKYSYIETEYSDIEKEFHELTPINLEPKKTASQVVQKIIIGGYDQFNLLGQSPNNKNFSDTPVISPPQNLPLDTSSLLSYSIFNEHSVIIGKDSMHGIGNNKDGRISNSLKKEEINHLTKFLIKNNGAAKLTPISAVCSSYGTLYMFSISSKNGNGKQLAYCDKGIKGDPVFLDIGDVKPLSLFGGCFHTAAIGDKGEIIFVNRKTVRDSPGSRTAAVSLPNGEIALSVSCLKDSIFVLSSKGRVFISSIESENNALNFSPVSELDKYEIIWLSGVHGHCLAVTNEGKVFGCGSNKHGQLCLDKKTISVTLFTEISAIKKYKIRAAYAGCHHSLFETSEGKILSCGANKYGQLLTNEKPGREDAYSLKETIVTSGATFCIAGSNFSAVFIGNCLPPNTPNKQIPYQKQTKLWKIQHL